MKKNKHKYLTEQDYKKTDQHIVRSQLRVKMQQAKQVKTPHIYIAGRIQSSRRFDLFDIVTTHDDNRRPKVAPQRMHTRHDLEFIYTGPYVYRCHHLCYENGGGFGPFRKDGICRSDKVGEGVKQTDNVFQRSKDGIKKADYVIAWIQDQECFGTLVQLGIAHSLGKKIYIARSTKIKPGGNLWFAFSTATIHQEFLDHKRGIAWCFQMIKRDLKIARPQNQAKICFGCWTDECPLRKQKIIHCWKCGQIDVFTKNCPKCGTNKKAKLE